MHVVVTLELQDAGVFATIFTNGRPSATYTFSGPEQVNTVAGSVVLDGFDGEMGDVMVFGVALSANQVQTQYQCGTVGV